MKYLGKSSCNDSRVVWAMKNKIMKITHSIVILGKVANYHSIFLKSLFKTHKSFKSLRLYYYQNLIRVIKNDIDIIFSLFFQ